MEVGAGAHHRSRTGRAMDADTLNLPGTGLTIVDIATTPTLLLVRIATTAASAVLSAVRSRVGPRPQPLHPDDRRPPRPRPARRPPAGRPPLPLLDARMPSGHLLRALARARRAPRPRDRSAHRHPSPRRPGPGRRARLAVVGPSRYPHESRHAPPPRQGCRGRPRIAAAIRRDRRLGLEQGAAVRDHRRRPGARSSHRPAAAAATPRPSSGGSPPTPASSSSVVTAGRNTRGPPRQRPPGPGRSPIAGTS